MKLRVPVLFFLALFITTATHAVKIKISSITNKSDLHHEIYIASLLTRDGSVRQISCIKETQTGDVEYLLDTGTHIELSPTFFDNIKRAFVEFYPQISATETSK